MNIDKSFKVFCLVLGDPTPFPVHPLREDDVGDLRILIKKAREDSILRGADPHKLVLWQLHEPEPVEPSETLAERIHSRGDDVAQFAARIKSVTDEMWEVFPQAPQKRHLHILVQPPLGRSTKILIASGALHELWRVCWNSGSNGSEIMRRHEIQRDKTHPPSGDVHVPPSCWVLSVEPWIKHLQPENEVSGFLVREEYVVALEEVAECYMNGKSEFATTSAGEENEETEENDDDMLIDDGACFPNPYSTLSTATPSAMGGFILLGHPGIGKTAWLHLVLVLRLQAGLPTVYQSNTDFMYLFDEGGVFECSCAGAKPEEFRESISESTWCLIDSNRNLPDVPTFITGLKRFIVQASSPRAARVAWRDKSIRPITQYIMKPWSLSEILAGRTLQGTVLSERELEQFYDRFGPSARSAYANADKLHVYDKALRAKISPMTVERLENLARSTTSLSMTEEITHQLLLVTPGDMRDSLETSIPTRYLLNQVRDQVCHGRLEATRRLYQMFLRTPWTKASAGHMLDDAIHVVFPDGGEWPIVRMISNRPGKRNTHWRKPDITTQQEYLQIGHNGQPIAVAPNSISNEAVPVVLKVHYFHEKENLTLEDGYYYPFERNQEMFDGFIFAKTGAIATIFQATDGMKHFLKNGGFTWLRQLGVEKFRVVIVGTPVNTKLDLAVSNSLGGFVSEVYLLVLQTIG